MLVELWVPITIAAAFLQALRSALQKRLLVRLSVNGATYCRFIYAAPFALAYPLLLTLGPETTLPTPNAFFVLFAAAGGVAQAVGTALLIYLFSLRNFATGVAYSKTEVVQTAVFSLVILGEMVTAMGAVAITVSLVGVVLISLVRDTSRPAWTGRAALVGLASGGLLGLSAVCYRAGALALADGGVLMRAAFTLAFTVTLQTVGMGLWIRARESGELVRVLQCWRSAWPVGLVGMLGSAGWFTAMTLENAAYVRAVGQIELVFAFAASVLFFRERPTPAESLGIALIMVGVVVLVLA